MNFQSRRFSYREYSRLRVDVHRLICLNVFNSLIIFINNIILLYVFTQKRQTSNHRQRPLQLLSEQTLVSKIVTPPDDSTMYRALAHLKVQLLLSTTNRAYTMLPQCKVQLQSTPLQHRNKTVADTQNEQWHLVRIRKRQYQSRAWSQ